MNILARSITKWTKACDKRLNRLISYIHHTCEYKQHCYVGNTAKQCRLGLFQDFDFAGDLENSKSTSGGTLCIFGSHTFLPIRWMCKKQTSVSHSSTESEIISLGAGLRLDGIPALDLWALMVLVSVFLRTTHDVGHHAHFPLTQKKDVRRRGRWAGARACTNALSAAHKACVYSVTMRVHARARCDARHTMHVAHTHMHAAWPFLAKAASAFWREPPALCFLPRFARWHRREAENGYRCTYQR